MFFFNQLINSSYDGLKIDSIYSFYFMDGDMLWFLSGDKFIYVCPKCKCKP